MEGSSLQLLIEALTDPQAYPHSVGDIEVKQTHTSVVFLTDTIVYKLKKPVQFGFLDYSTLEKRKYYCKQEVTLNRRLAPDVYLGVVPVTETDRGIRIDGAGTIREWAVQMKRVPEEATLESRVREGRVRVPHIRAIARKIADFHRAARGGDDISRYGTFDVVSRNVIDNFTQTSDHVGHTVSAELFDRARDLTRAELRARRPLIERRAADNRPRETHGDLRLEHVYLLPAGDNPDRIIAVDCIEFSDRLRYTDPVADIAFLVMDLKISGRRDLAAALVDEYFRRGDDPDGRALLPLYTSYRSIVRAKVLGIRARQEEIPAGERDRSLRQANAHWLLGLDELETPGRRPCLLLLSGLPGTGKSTVAEKLARTANFEVISTDKIRRMLQMAGGAGDTNLEPYSESSKEAVYEECLERASSALKEGQRVIVDATFHRARRRIAFIKRAQELGVRVLRLICETDRSVARRRLVDRKDSLSDADWDVYRALSKDWEEPTDYEQSITRTIATDRALSETLSEALEYLREAGVYDS